MAHRQGGERQGILERSAQHHSDQQDKRQALAHQKAATDPNRGNQPQSEYEEPLAPEEDPAFAYERGIVRRIMMRSPDDILSKYPIIGEPFPTVASMKAAQLEAKRQRDAKANRKTIAPRKDGAKKTTSGTPAITASPADDTASLGSSWDAMSSSSVQEMIFATTVSGRRRVGANYSPTTSKTDDE